MSRITSNIPAVVAQRHLLVSQRELGVALERLSSGIRINRGADDPAGLIVSERLRAEIEGLNQAINNSHRAINVIATTEGALNEVSALLIDIQGLIVEAANSGAFSPEERDANQLQIDSAIESIGRIANVTTFAGRKLLDGSLDYITSGIDTAHLANTSVLGAKFGSRDHIPVKVQITQSAQKAQLMYDGGTPLPGPDAVTVDIQGPNGIVALSFPANMTQNEMVEAIQSQTDATGVTASAGAAGEVYFQSTSYGSREFVRVETIEGSAAFEVKNRDGGGDKRTEGVDTLGTINGYSTIGDGLSLSLNSFLLDIDITLDEDFGGGLGVTSSTFDITGGGSLFQLGPQVNTNQQENIGIKAMHPNKLGSRLVGYLSELSSGQTYALREEKFQNASNTIQLAIEQVATLRGRLGAFERNTLQTNINQLQITVENLTSSESVIRDTDFAEETTELTRAQILVQAGNSILAIANAQQQSVLSLLGG
ncbi:MAG: flagellin [Phycisphaerae bacterium]|nr:flagellin [Phycisphaerae bacterium]